MIGLCPKTLLLPQVPEDPVNFEGPQIVPRFPQFPPNQFNGPKGIGPDFNLLRASGFKENPPVYSFREVPGIA